MKPRLPRLALLKTESRLDETEVKSEAQFQKILASMSGLPVGPGRSRWIDRGRYPEEAVADDEFQKEDTPSDDEEDYGFGESSSATYFNFKPSHESEPISITKPSTPAPSDIGESLGMRGISESPSVMDIDFVSPQLFSSLPVIKSDLLCSHPVWRLLHWLYRRNSGVIRPLRHRVLAL